MIRKPSDKKSYIGLERSLMVQAQLMKSLRDERRLFASELRALDRETQTVSVLERKDALAKRVPQIEQEMMELQKSLKEILEGGREELDPKDKFYVLAQKLVRV